MEILTESNSEDMSVDDILSDLDTQKSEPSEIVEAKDIKAEEPNAETQESEIDHIVEHIEKTVPMDASSDTKVLIKQFVQRYINILNEKKKINEDIKALKQEFIEQGIAVGTVIKAFNECSKYAKMSYSQSSEIEGIRSIIENDPKIMEQITDYLDLKG